MQHTPFGSYREGMNVCDLDGDKIGTIKMVHQLGRSVGSVTPTNEGYAQVETGFLGLGNELYIPLNACRNCDQDCCFLNVDKDDIDRMGWDTKPVNIL